MLRQTRNALIYADLALFVLDAREGITWQDVALYKWLSLNKMRIKSDEQAIKAQEAMDGNMDEFETPAIVPTIMENLKKQDFA